MHSFTLDRDELNRMERCPGCKSREHLKILQGFGAKVRCEKCELEGPFVPGHNFEQERASGIRAWNEDVKKIQATFRSRREFREMRDADRRVSMS